MVRDIALHVVLKYVGIQEFAMVASTCKSFAKTMRSIVDDGKLFDANAIANKDVRFERAVLTKCNKIAILLLTAGVSQEARDRSLQLALRVYDQKMARDILASGVSQEARDQSLQLALRVHDQKMAWDILASGVSKNGRDQALVNSMKDFEGMFNYLLSEGAVSQDAIDEALSKLTRSKNSIYPYQRQFNQLLTKVTQGAYEEAFMKFAGNAHVSMWFDHHRIFAQRNDHLFEVAIQQGNLGAVRLLVVNAADDRVRRMEKLKLLIDKWTMTSGKFEAVDLMLKSFTPSLKPKQLAKILYRATGSHPYNVPDVATIKALVKSNMLSHQDTNFAKKVLKGVYHY
jgi:hypothetical protein